MRAAGVTMEKVACSYRSTWDEQYQAGGHKTKDFEWHCTYSQLRGLLCDDGCYWGRIRGLAGGSLSGGRRPVLLDLGCGSSNLAQKLARELCRPHIILADISPVMLDVLVRSFVTNHRQKSNPKDRVTIVRADCRDLGSGVEVWWDSSSSERRPQAVPRDSGSPPRTGDESAGGRARITQTHLRSTDPAEVDGLSPPEVEIDGLISRGGILPGQVDVILDKGTLDALFGEDDKRLTIEACMRTLAKHGLLISIGFGAVQRLSLLETLCGMGVPPGVRATSGGEATSGGHRSAYWAQCHFLGSGDPARGHEVRLVAVLGHADGPPPPEYRPSELTRRLLARYRRYGSLLEEEEDEDEARPWDQDEA